MKKLKITYFFTLVMLLSLGACSTDSSSDADIQKPTIAVYNPMDGQEVHAGEELLIKIDFTDNIGLASYKIDIHYSDDGHIHRTTDTTTNELWAYEFSEPISGKNITKELSIEVPQNTEGTYHFGVFAIDTSGNQNLVWQSIHIHND